MTAYTIALAHIQGVPVEEVLFSWLGGAGAGLMMVLASRVGRLRLIRTRRR